MARHIGRSPISTAEQLVALGASLFSRGLTFGRTGICRRWTMTARC